MIVSVVLFISCLLASSQGGVGVVPPEGGHIAKGRFVIPAGDHLVRIAEEKGAWLTVGDSTDLVIDGNLRLEGNGFRSCDVIKVTGSNVTIRGKGAIVGDRWTHQGEEGEWGMGVRLHGATDVTVKDLTIADCWGDCIYVGGNSSKVTIDGCVLRGSRRQGISITKAGDVTISDCQIADISGTNPQYGIDIEPNRNCSVNDVLIENVDVVNCEGGIRALVPKAGIGNAEIGTVVIRRCQVSAKSRYPVHFSVVKTGTVEGCTIEATNERPCINANHVENLKVCDNTLNVDTKLFASIKNKLRKWVGRKNAVIRVANGSAEGVKNNKIVKS